MRWPLPPHLHSNAADLPNGRSSRPLVDTGLPVGCSVGVACCCWGGAKGAVGQPPHGDNPSRTRRRERLLSSCSGGEFPGKPPSMPRQQSRSLAANRVGDKVWGGTALLRIVQRREMNQVLSSRLCRFWVWVGGQRPLPITAKKRGTLRLSRSSQVHHPRNSNERLETGQFPISHLSSVNALFLFGASASYRGQTAAGNKPRPAPGWVTARRTAPGRHIGHKLPTLRRPARCSHRPAAS